VQAEEREQQERGGENGELHRLAIYMATIITTVDIMMSVTMRTSSMSPEAA